VLHEAREIYEFEVRGLRVEDDRVSFYINAVDGVAAAAGGATFAEGAA
jgi:hypothetical protein